MGLTEGKTLHDLLNEKISLADDWEIDANDVVVFVDQKLGEGAFGEVYKGTVSGSCLTKNPQLLSEVKKLACVPVAIKVLKGRSSHCAWPRACIFYFNSNFGGCYSHQSLLSNIFSPC